MKNVTHIFDHSKQGSLCSAQALALAQVGLRGRGRREQFQVPLRLEQLNSRKSGEMSLHPSRTLLLSLRPQRDWL
jgi:hypothetical protein